MFSVDTTPQLPVADAARISMSLPLIFKPVLIRGEAVAALGAPAWLAGVWVDGGYLNNLPVRVFDDEPGANPETVGVRLDLDPPTKVMDGLFPFLASWFQLGFFGTGESRINASEGVTDRTMSLDTTGLSLIEFAPPKEVIERATEAAYKVAREYLNDIFFEDDEVPPIRVPR